ncbi:MAG: cytochrome c [Caulobacterales bacterium]|nr:cytochrome c [Caulobacterales bacterium]
MARGVTVIVLGLAFVGFAGAALGGAKSDRPAARGHAVARRICAACHAVEPGAQTSNNAAPAFASREMQHVAGLEDRVATLTREGHKGMPPQTLTPAEVADLVAYIESLAPTKGEPSLNERPLGLPVRPRG